MRNPLFSAYRQGENRITASIMAVFERVNLALVEQILRSALQTSELSLVSFDNQPQRGGKTRPDARLHGRFSFWFEVKTTESSVNVDQIKGHLQSLNEDHYGGHERLIVITPDNQQPREIDQANDRRVVWINFEALYHAIEDAKTLESPMPSEREIFLLNELCNMLVSEGLVGAASDQVLIVPAREALETYLEYSAYLCQPNRTFRKVERMGFYKDGKIQPWLPKILGSIESIRISQDWADSVEGPLEADLQRHLETLIIRVLEDHWFEDGELLKVLALTAKDSTETITLDAPIENDSTKDGRPVAWVQNQRYVSIQSLRGSKVTSALQSV